MARVNMSVCQHVIIQIDRQWSENSQFMSTCNGLCVVTSGCTGNMIEDLLRLLDPDYFRSVRLQLARAELHRLQQVPSKGTFVESSRASAIGASSTADDAASDVACRSSPAAAGKAPLAAGGVYQHYML
jgi:hypothetical protein